MWRVGEPLDMGVCQWCGKVCGAWWDVWGVRNAVRGSASGERWGGEVCATVRRARGGGGMAGPADVSAVEQGGWHCRTYARQSLEGGIKGRGAGAADAGDKVKGVGVGGACTVGSWCWRALVLRQQCSRGGGLVRTRVCGQCNLVMWHPHWRCTSWRHGGTGADSCGDVAATLWVCHGGVVPKMVAVVQPPAMALDNEKS